MLRFKYYWILFIGVIGFGGVGCNQIPDYPDAPRISFNDYKLLPKAGSTTLDSLLITINYTDGDGDLGLRNEETGPPYNEYAPEDTDQSNPLLTHYNWWMKMKGKKDGVFVDAYIPQPLAFYQRFPLLRDQSTKSVIDGIINYDVLITYIPNQRRPASHPIDQADPLDPSKVLYLDDTIAFEIRILDRALNQSNVILTSPIIVGQRKD